nr:serine O-acetyltransferase [Halovivax gelatinilyticus]
MLSAVREDVSAMCERDPAATDPLTVALTYPGLHAVWSHRLAHERWTRGNCLSARLLATAARAVTGVEIHPAADLGRRVTIDHGMGVVIGETAVVADDVHLYHGVTLGGDVNERVKRHPTIESGVTIGANATVLGDVRVGREATIGAGSVVTSDVPAETTVAGVPASPVG